MPADRPVLLVVDDDHLVRVTLADALAEEGFDVIEAEDGAAALALICARPDIAAMLTDVNLGPGADGFALARAARVVRPDLPVLYASGRIARPDPDSAVAGSRFLGKPFPVPLAAPLLSDMVLRRADAPAITPVPPAALHRC
jgi:CheY-like chemotaxis protein